MKERIQKLLGGLGVDSRRNIEKMVLQGRISVNGKAVTKLPVLVDPDVDQITVDDEPVKMPQGKSVRKICFLLNKPRGVYSANVQEGTQTRAIDLLPENFSGRVYPIGQLEAEAKGLLLLSNDGELTNKLTHPRNGIGKTYRAIVDGHVEPDILKQLEQGIWLTDTDTGQGFKSGKCKITVIRTDAEKSTLEISIQNERQHQVRRMLAKVGHKVRDLTRTRFGPLSTEGLRPGQVRELTGREMRELVEWADRQALEAPPAPLRSKRPRPGGFSRPQGTRPNSSRKPGATNYSDLDEE